MDIVEGPDKKGVEVNKQEITGEQTGRRKGLRWREKNEKTEKEWR